MGRRRRVAGGELFYIQQIKNWKPSNNGGGGGCWPMIVLVIVASVLIGVLIYLGKET